MAMHAASLLTVKPPSLLRGVCNFAALRSESRPVEGLLDFMHILDVAGTRAVARSSVGGVVYRVAAVRADRANGHQKGVSIQQCASG